MDFSSKTDHSDLEAAAAAINQESLLKAKLAIEERCKEHLRWMDLMEDSLGSKINVQKDLKKFAKALALCQLGYLPTKPETCPFCIQYSKGRSCIGCGYAATHGGRCDLDTSAFSQFIEAFQELGSEIYQDQEAPDFDFDLARKEIEESIHRSKDAAVEMLEGLCSLSTFQLMERKACYIEKMIDLVPARLLSEEVQKKRCQVKEKLKSYW